MRNSFWKESWDEYKFDNVCPCQETTSGPRSVPGGQHGAKRRRRFLFETDIHRLLLNHIWLVSDVVIFTLMSQDNVWRKYLERFSRGNIVFLTLGPLSPIQCWFFGGSRRVFLGQLGAPSRSNTDPPGERGLQWYFWGYRSNLSQNVVFFGKKTAVGSNFFYIKIFCNYIPWATWSMTRISHCAPVEWAYWPRSWEYTKMLGFWGKTGTLMVEK